MGDLMKSVADRFLADQPCLWCKERNESEPPAGTASMRNSNLTFRTCRPHGEKAAAQGGFDVEWDDEAEPGE